jgi:hypothetical protein
MPERSKESLEAELKRLRSENRRLQKENQALRQKPGPAVRDVPTAESETVRRQGIPDFRRPALRECFDSSGCRSGGFVSVV